MIQFGKEAIHGKVTMSMNKMHKKTKNDNNKELYLAPGSPAEALLEKTLNLTRAANTCHLAFAVFGGCFSPFWLSRLGLVFLGL